MALSEARDVRVTIRCIVWALHIYFVLTCGLLGPELHAEESLLPLSGFVHRTWTARTGAPGEIFEFAQTPDGMLWIASMSGLFQFDGIRFVEVHGKPGGALVLDSVSSLYASPRGGLWVGLRYGGVVFLKQDNFTEYPPGDVLPDGTVNALAEDRSGVLWTATVAGVVRFQSGRWERLGKDWGLPAGYAATLFVDRTDAVWVWMRDGLYVLRPGARQFTKESLGQSVRSFAVQHGTVADSPDGTIWLAESAKGPRPIRVNQTVLVPEATAVQIDQEGALWYSSGSDVRRIMNAHQVAKNGDAPIIEHFGRSDGLLVDVNILFKDREGNIWVGSTEGIDLFVPTSLQMVRLTTAGFAMTRAHDGLMWWAEDHDNESGWRINRYANEKVVELLDIADPVTCAYTDQGGTLWFAGPNKVWQFDGNQLTLLPAPRSAPELPTQALVRARDGSLWRSVVRGGVFRYVGGEWQRNGGLETLPQDPAIVMTDDESGRLWFGYTNNRVALLVGGSVTMLGPADGIDVGNVTAIETRGQHVWIGGEHGLMHFDGTHFAPVRVAGENPFRNLWGVVETQRGELWAAGGRSLILLNRSQLADVLANRVPEKPPQLFDYRDGVMGQVQALRPLPALREAGDGRIWFALTNGLGYIDAAHIAPKTTPPPVSIQTVRAGGRDYSPYSELMQLPTHTTQLRVGYTAASFAAPERIRFRYRLEGLDKEWQSVGEQREAVYTNLSPGAYRFRVSAANRDSPWSEPGAGLEFTIPPAFYQTRWFYALCLLLAGGLLTLLFRLRMRQVTIAVQSRLEERIGERERIARELHDTLLQGFQGLMLRLQAVADRVKSEPEQAHRLIEQTLQRADAVLEEGRDRVKNLRGSGAARAELSDIFIRAAEDAQPHAMKVRITVEGAVRELQPIVREEVARIGTEAMTNAFAHAKGSSLDVAIFFERRRFALRISDDGIGIDPTIVNAGREGHFGLTGMRERARNIRGKISIASRPGGGTEIELMITAGIAYAARRSAFARWRRKRFSPRNVL